MREKTPPKEKTRSFKPREGDPDAEKADRAPARPEYEATPDKGAKPAAPTPAVTEEDRSDADHSA